MPVLMECCSGQFFSVSLSAQHNIILVLYKVIAQLKRVRGSFGPWPGVTFTVNFMVEGFFPLSRKISAYGKKNSLFRTDY